MDSICFKGKEAVKEKTKENAKKENQERSRMEEDIKKWHRLHCKRNNSREDCEEFDKAAINPPLGAWETLDSGQIRPHCKSPGLGDEKHGWESASMNLSVPQERFEKKVHDFFLSLLLMEFLDQKLIHWFMAQEFPKASHDPQLMRGNFLRLPKIQSSCLGIP